MSDQSVTYTALPGVSHIGLGLEAIPVDPTTAGMNRLVSTFRELGNPILDVQGGVLIAVNQIEPVNPDVVVIDGIAHDNSEFVKREMVWKCDWDCGQASKSRIVTEFHELYECPLRPEEP